MLVDGLAVHAMFNRNRVLLTVLVALFIAYIAGLCVLLAVSIPMMEFNPPTCIVTSTPTTFFFDLVSYSAPDPDAP